MNKLRFYAFHLMPYPDIPPTAEFDSSWVSLSNKYYNPHRGRVLYNEYIDQLASAEDFGFDGVGVNEHHANYYGTMPSPNIIAAMLIQRTNRIPIGVIGNAIPLHGNPLRVAGPFDGDLGSTALRFGGVDATPLAAGTLQRRQLVVGRRRQQVDIGAPGQVRSMHQPVAPHRGARSLAMTTRG